MNDASIRLAFVRLLQKAYSGELAAAYAYRGHSKSLSCFAEKTDLEKIERDEWNHRHLLGEILSKLGASPNPLREIRSALIGHALSVLCLICGWFLPMYMAGRLERKNIAEYQQAARLACLTGHPQFEDCFLHMAETEWDHEHFFRTKVLSHRLSRVFPHWPQPGPRETLRMSQSKTGHPFFDRSSPGE